MPAAMRLAVCSPEPDLALAFGVSRQTIRQAIGQLRSLKLLSARKGIGTRVESKEPKAAYYQALQSLTDVFQYAHATVLRVTQVDRVVARGRQALELSCRPGHEWLRLTGVREIMSPDGGRPPLCFVTVWVDGRYGAVADQPAEHHDALFTQIEARFGVPATEVLQDLEATLLDASSAGPLGAKPGGPALRIIRRYVGPSGESILVSDSIYPAERFRYSMRIRRDLSPEIPPS
ncbi:GntR family transcriptional regulator [Pseudoroseomonas wenyumeiae]